MEHREYKAINKSVRKKDAMQLLLGKPVYTDDVTPRDALVVKLLRSPHANAIVQSIDTSTAKLVPGVVDVYTWEDVPKTRFAIAGQTYPEPSPYDRLILDQHGHTRVVPRGAISAIFADGKDFVVDGAEGRQIVRYKATDISIDAAADALRAHRYPWIGATDPHAHKYSPWIDGNGDSTDDEDHAFRARRRALEKKDRQEAEAALERLQSFGLVVRDRQGGQEFRRLD